MDSMEGGQCERHAGDATDVWIIPLVNSSVSAQAYLPWFDKHELARMHGLSFIVDRLVYAESHGWLRRILSEYSGIPPAALCFRRSETGKPALVSSTIRFSLSHTQGCVAIAVSGKHEVGVDVERVRRLETLEGIDKLVLQRDEQAWLEGLPAEDKYRSFFRLWTVKEAYTKALGHGFAHPFKQLTVNLPDESTCELRDGASDASRQRHCSIVIKPGWPLDEFALAVVSFGGAGAVMLHSVTIGCRPVDPAIDIAGWRLLHNVPAPE